MHSAVKLSLLRFELPSFEELALLASMLPVPIMNYSEADKVAFVILVGPGRSAIIYYSRLEKKPEGKFIHVDKITGRVTYGDKVSLEPNQTSIPLFTIKKHDLGAF